MTKKHYEAAAAIVQELRREPGADPVACAMVEDAFTCLFRNDNPRFDEARFRKACVPGANVRARG